MLSPDKEMYSIEDFFTAHTGLSLKVLMLLSNLLTVMSQWAPMLVVKRYGPKMV